jgi:hypothetical protein
MTQEGKKIITLLILRSMCVNPGKQTCIMGQSSIIAYSPNMCVDP